MTCFLTSLSSVGVVDLVGVLGREHHGVDPDRPVVGVVLDRDLGLAVRTQVGERPVLADLGQPLREPLGDHDRQRHQLGRVVAGVAEHQALVAGAALVEVVVGGADPRLVAVVDALGDVERLAAEGDLHSAGGPVEALERGVVADVEDRRAHELGDRRVGVGPDLARDHDQTGGEQGLDRGPQVLAVGVVLHQVVEHGVADPVGDLVGVALGHRLRREETSVHARAHSLVRGWEAGLPGRSRATLSRAGPGPSMQDRRLTRRIVGRPGPRSRGRAPSSSPAVRRRRRRRPRGSPPGCRSCRRPLPR